MPSCSSCDAEGEITIFPCAVAYCEHKICSRCEHSHIVAVHGKEAYDRRNSDMNRELRFDTIKIVFGLVGTFAVLIGVSYLLS